MPSAIRVTIGWVRGLLQEPLMVEAGEGPVVDRGEVFRTDAKGETGKMTIGGYCFSDDADLLKCRWFSLVITQDEAPWLFDQEGQARTRIAAGELLGSMAGALLFVPADTNVIHRDAVK